MRQVTEYNEQVRLAAMQYVSAYLRDVGLQRTHRDFMQVLDNTRNAEVQQLAECIDLLLWERDQQQALDIAEDLDAWAPDHEQWSATY